MSRPLLHSTTCLITVLLLAGSRAAAPQVNVNLQQKIDEVVRPLVEANDIPGMAIAISVNGKRFYYNYGVASIAEGRPVTEHTLFEVGSISKIFTATLGTYAEQSGVLSLSDNASKHLPFLKGSAFDNINLLNLVTYTAGGLPLQMPDNIPADNFVSFYTAWQPQYAPGTHRQYSNASIGLFGHLVAASFGKPYSDLLEQTLFPALGLKHTYIRVPQARMGDYAFGYSKEGKPIRVNPGLWDAEAYGVKTSASDLLRFLDLNMNARDLDTPLGRALRATQTGYYQVGPMIQSLGWESYAIPADETDVLRGNSSDISLKANKTEALSPPLSPDDPALFNKTGSTNGFGGYVAFLPSKKTGIVILANKNYPNAERISAAYRILEALQHPLDGQPRQHAH